MGDDEIGSISGVGRKLKNQIDETNTYMDAAWKAEKEKKCPVELFNSSDIASAAGIPLVKTDRADIPPAKDVKISSDSPTAMKTAAATEEVGNMEFITELRSITEPAMELITELRSAMEPIEDSDNDGVPDAYDVNPNGESVSPATQAFLDEIFHTDTDGDGVLDFLDRTGSESQMEQWIDAEFEMQTENVRAFATLMSIFNNLDLTKFSKQFTEPGGDSLTVMVAAGAAQVAITHSAALQNLPTNVQLKKKDVKKLINLGKKSRDLTNLQRAAEALPETDPMREPILKACESALAKRGNNAVS
ncbi:MAG: hypothetical protein LBJ81_01215 [Puniceicoccales bacterium]|jgi:hypothetical protein|nr:hypothetical protein [Puniceicoccales bacterium]